MTSHRTHAAILLVVLASGLAGCDGGGSRSATAPSPQPQQAPRPATNSLSGVVYEMTSTGRIPVEGVLVQSDYFHAFPTPDVVTDAQGFFSFRPVWVCPCEWAPWVNAGITAIVVDKEGYEAPAGQPPSVFRHPLYPEAPHDLRVRDVTISGDTRFDVELVRRSDHDE